MPKSLEERVTELEERVTTLTNEMTALEGQVQAQPRKFIPEDSIQGICTGKPCSND